MRALNSGFSTYKTGILTNVAGKWRLRKTNYLKMVFIEKEITTYGCMQFTAVTVVD
jgi:hypothetical protein